MTTDADKDELARQGLEPIEPAAGDEAAKAALAAAGDGEDGEKDEAAKQAEIDAAAAEAAAAAEKLDPDVQKLIDDARNEGRAEAETDAERIQRERDEARAAEDQVTELRGHRAATKEKIAKLTFPFKAEDGTTTEFNLAPDVIAAIHKEIDANYDQDHAHHARILQDRITASVLKLVPEEKRAATEKALDYAKNADELVQLMVDAAAPAASSMKNNDLDELVKLSPKAARQLGERIVAAKTAERKRVMELHGIEGEPTLTGKPPAATDDELTNPHTPPARLAERLAAAGAR